MQNTAMFISMELRYTPSLNLVNIDTIGNKMVTGETHNR
jgi:hypothetical protein